MGLPLVLTMLAAGVFLLWAGLTDRSPLSELISFTVAGKPTTKATP